MKLTIPRIVIAGISGDSGKTFVSCGVLNTLKNKGLSVIPFKKGPDYIDPEWLTTASGIAARNLDTFLFDREKNYEIFCKYAFGKDIAVIEGNRGLYDGFDELGTHSTAELAKLLKAPVIVSLTINKITRTAAAIIYGLKHFDHEVEIKGVILNQTAGNRQTDLISKVIEDTCGIPVIGAIPKLKNKDLLPSRHLGLVTPLEHNTAIKAVEEAGKAIEDYVDVQKLIDIAKTTPDLDFEYKSVNFNTEKSCKIGVFVDKAFSFYYAENLEALIEKGAEIIEISSIDDKTLPDCNAVYIGGGFPETNIREICHNKDLMRSLKIAAENGLPIYAECGGLIYLCKDIELNEDIFELSGIFPVGIKMSKKPAGHGYSTSLVQKHNPFYPIGLQIKGHEFHYASINKQYDEIEMCLEMTRGNGAVNGWDGLFYKNVFATWQHTHSQGLPEWSDAMIRLAITNKNILS